MQPDDYTARLERRVEELERQLRQVQRWIESVDDDVELQPRPEPKRRFRVLPGGLAVGAAVVAAGSWVRKNPAPVVASAGAVALALGMLSGGEPPAEPEPPVAQPPAVSVSPEPRVSPTEKPKPPRNSAAPPPAASDRPAEPGGTTKEPEPPRTETPAPPTATKPTPGPKPTTPPATEEPGRERCLLRISALGLDVRLCGYRHHRAPRSGEQ